ncbi:hypothetical protein L218DRAFT_193708 [Marasmius fiardii PR-910]|nr:hypothetical protein L218DRAFT_193708 [Marasmius fiardii PR-910]
MYDWRTSLGYQHDSDHIMDPLSPASLDPPSSRPNPSCRSNFDNWDSMPLPLHMDSQDDYKIRDMNRVALLERNYCSSFFCCDIRLSGFHELLEHIEDVHFVLTNDKHGNKRYLYEPVGVSKNVSQLLSPHQQEENSCSPFNASRDFEKDYELDDNDYTDPYAFWGYHGGSEPPSPSLSPSPTISSASVSSSSSSSSASSPMTSPVLLPTRAPALPASPPPVQLPKATITSHVSLPSTSSEPVPLIAPIPSAPIRYDLVAHEDHHYSHESKRTFPSSSKGRWKQLSGSHTTATATATATATITAAGGTGYRKRSSGSGDREKLYRCPTVGCTKAYLNPNGLKYHREKGKCSFEEDAIIRLPR